MHRLFGLGTGKCASCYGPWRAHMCMLGHHLRMQHMHNMGHYTHTAGEAASTCGTTVCAHTRVPLIRPTTEIGRPYVHVWCSWWSLGDLEVPRSRRLDLGRVGARAVQRLRTLVRSCVCHSALGAERWIDSKSNSNTRRASDRSLLHGVMWVRSSAYTISKQHPRDCKTSSK